VEIGLGGRLDSTNVLRPLAGILTNVSRDHVPVLGRSVRSIAREKIGFLKPGMRFSCDLRASGVVREVVLDACRTVGVECLRIGSEILVDRGGVESDGASRTSRFSVRCGTGSYPDLSLGVLGSHQEVNAALVVGVLDALRAAGDLRVDAAEIRRGLARFRCPGRIELLSESPVVLVDGAHNPAAARVLRSTLDEEFPGRRAAFVIAIARDKEWRTVLRNLLRGSDEVIATRTRNPRFLDPERIAGEASRLGFRARVVLDPIEAMRSALPIAGPEGYVCATGSFYLIGDVRSRMTEWIPGVAAATSGPSSTAGRGGRGAS
jgi:dihydrofolate synthase/folylpolyglutamate synthase